MAVMIAELYDALKDAGATEDKSRKAAETMAAYENRFAGIETRLTRIEGDLGLLKWMVATVIAANIALMIKAFA